MRRTAIVVALGSLLISALDAQDRSGSTRGQAVARSGQAVTSPRSARDFRRLTVPGAEVERGVQKLREEMRWHKSLGAALAAGRSQQKPVLWIQALGDLDGFL